MEKGICYADLESTGTAKKARETLSSQRKESHGNIYRSSRYENALKSLHSRYAYRENGLSGKSAYYEYLSDTTVISPIYW